MQKGTPASIVNTTASASRGDNNYLPLEVKKRTELENKKMELNFRVFKVDQPPEVFQEKHYLNLKNICQRLGNGNRSVKMINDLLRIIFSTKDATNEAENHERQLTCIQFKFHLCNDLAMACKISI